MERRGWAVEDEGIRVRVARVGVWERLRWVMRRA